LNVRHILIPAITDDANSAVARSIMTMEPTGNGLVPDEWMVVAVVSVTVNVCALLRGIVSRVVFAVVCRRRRRCSSSTLADCESEVDRRPTLKKPAHDDVLVVGVSSSLARIQGGAKNRGTASKKVALCSRPACNFTKC